MIPLWFSLARMGHQTHLARWLEWWQMLWRRKKAVHRLDIRCTVPRLVWRL
jgi:hypothetical protein